MIEGKSRTETVEKAIAEEKERVVNELGYDPTNVITRGNHSFVIISNRADEILKILDGFEKNNPRLEITSWHLKESYIFNNVYNMYRSAYCLFIDHKKKS